MIKLDESDCIVHKIMQEIPTEFKTFMQSVLRNGISRQQFKMLKVAIDSGKSQEILNQICACDLTTESGHSKAASLAGVQIIATCVA